MEIEGVLIWMCRGNRINTPQFRIRHLLIATLFVAVAIVAIQFCATRYSSFLSVGLILIFMLAIAGVWGICVSIMCAFAILVSNRDVNQRYNLQRCFQLFGIGIVSTLPLGICFVYMLPDLMKS